MANGRPKKEIDFEQLEALMRLKPTLADTAAFFKTSERTIERIIRKNFKQTFVEFREQGMVHTRLALQRKAIHMGESGNVAMLIFCLKNMCGWTDKIETSGTTEIEGSVTYTTEWGTVTGNGEKSKS